MTFNSQALVFLAALLGTIDGFAGTVADLSDPPSYQETITLEEVVARVLLHNPELKVFSLEQRAKEARALQSGLLPNPRLTVEVENVAGSGGFSGFNRSETTMRLSQLVELGDKRAARMRASSHALDFSSRDYEVKRIDVLTRAQKAFIDLLRAERQVELNNELLALAEKSLAAVSERVRAGKVSPIEKTRAEIEFSAAKMEVERGLNERLAAGRNLAVIWGETQPPYRRPLGDLERFDSVPALETLRQRMDQSPDLELWAMELVRRQAAVDLELARATPDVSLEAGYRRLEETHDNALLFGISIPLPLFNRNQGSIAEARHRLARAEAQQAALAIDLNHRLALAHQALTLAHAEVLSLRAEVVPGAERAYQAMTEGYRFGKFDFLEVLDSQRTLFQVRLKYLQALVNYHKAVADVERLVGTVQGASSPPAGKEERSHEN